MSIDGNRIIAKPGVGVSDWEPYQLLNVAARTTGYEINFICSNLHGKIKIFSFHKPVSYPQKHPALTDEQIRSVNCGLSFPFVSEISKIKALFDGDMNGWGYQPPTGGAGSPYRISDFDGYTHNPTPLVAGLIIPASAYGNNQAGTFNVSASVSQAEDSVKVSDLKQAGVALSTFYFGVLLVPDSFSGSSFVMTAGQSVANDVVSITVPSWRLLPTQSGSWRYAVYPFLSARPITALTTVGADSQNANDKFVPLPLVDPAKITVYAYADRISIDPYIELGTTSQVKVHYTLHSTISAGVFQDVYVFILHPDTPVPDPSNFIAYNHDVVVHAANIQCSGGTADGTISVTLSDVLKSAVAQGWPLRAYMKAKGPNGSIIWAMQEVAVQQEVE